MPGQVPRRIAPSITAFADEVANAHLVCEDSRMSDLGVLISFDQPESAVAFSRGLAARIDVASNFHVATLEPRLNMDAATILLVLKFAGPALGAIGGFLAAAQAVLKLIRKPSVRMEIDGKSLELHADASPEDVKLLCDVLLRSNK